MGLAGLGALGLVAALLGANGLRDDLSTVQLAGTVAAFSGLALVAIAALALALRPKHAPPMGGFTLSMAAAVLVLPSLLAAVPDLWPGTPLPAGIDPAMLHTMCGLGGLTCALAVADMVLLFGRDDEAPAWNLLLAAGAGGLLGFVLQGLYCHVADPVHLLLAHGLPGLLLAGGLLLARGVGRLRLA